MKAGDKVVVIDDVLTTGGSVIQAIEAVEAIGAKVVARGLHLRPTARCARSAGEIRLPPAVHDPRFRDRTGE